ncbi:uncharacterized protein LOC110817500 [Carica papaya]|uniref:uncharacterized protein LOC110817500 n=1 Tax=Carica papaya TaxID=3649 RepID=UPI000B8C744B|nr:uncharacterized protein LOC110817500 [Carica papaya]
MDEQEFRRLLELFPVVRSRDYCVESDSQRQSTSRSKQNEEMKEWQDAWSDGDKKEVIKEDLHDAFWEKLKAAAEGKVGAADAERFCKAFIKIHKKLVNEELSLSAARRLVNQSKK